MTTILLIKMRVYSLKCTHLLRERERERERESLTAVTFSGKKCNYMKQERLHTFCSMYIFWDSKN